MFWCRLLTVFLLVTPVLGVEEKAPAQATTPEALMPPGESRGQVNIDVKQRPFRDILQYLERVSGWNLVPMDERVGDLQITVRVTNMYWRDALDVIAIKEKLMLTDDLKSRVIYIDKPPPITMSFENTDIRTVINAIAKAGNASVIIGPNITGTVTMNLQDIPWREALDIVLKTLGYVLVEEKHGVLRVATPAELEQQMETRVYKLSYLLPRGAGYTAKMETEFATRSTTAAGGKADIEDTLKAVIEKVKSNNGSIAYEKRTNSVVVTDTPAKLESISNIIRQLDIPPKQVHFSVKMIELNDTDKENLGLQWDNGFTAEAGGAGFQTLFPFPNGSANNVLQGSGLPGDVGLGLSGGILTKSKVAPYSGAAPDVTLGTLDFSKLTAVLNFVKKHTSGRTIQAPELMCLDNEEATIQVGDLIRYAEAAIETTPSGGTTSGWKEAVNSPVKLGVQILVIPHVTGPENNILLTIIPKVEAATGAQLFKDFVSPSLGTLSLPQTSQRIVVTKMMLRNGETGVIGGLRNELKGEIVTKVPLLGDIPILGWLFRSRSRPEDNNKSTNLIILITGTVIDFMEKNDLKDRLAPAQKQLKDIFQVYGEQ
jgi:type IV pilus assembly protein PilQ